jgi:hypothetical protein
MRTTGEAGSDEKLGRNMRERAACRLLAPVPAEGGGARAVPRPLPNRAVVAGCYSAAHAARPPPPAGARGGPVAPANGARGSPSSTCLSRACRATVCAAEATTVEGAAAACNMPCPQLACTSRFFLCSSFSFLGLGWSRSTTPILLVGELRGREWRRDDKRWREGSRLQVSTRARGGRRGSLRAARAAGRGEPSGRPGEARGPHSAGSKALAAS